MKFGTKVIRAGITPDETTGAVMTPVYQTSTYHQVVPGEHKGFEYSRTQNPTRKVLEENIAALENGKYGLCFASGMAAIDGVLRLLKPGDEVISTNDLYGGSYRIFTKVYQQYGIKFHFVDLSDVSNLMKLVNENTKLIWVETPTNPLLSIIDIKAVCDTVSRDILVCVDNTFATPYLQQPLMVGADIVVHSVTKYLSGHSDVVMGAIVVNDLELRDRLAFYQNACGAIPGPMDCFLVLRGIKTLHLRMDRHCKNAEQVAQFLEGHPKVAKVFYPGLKQSKGYAIAYKQMKNFGGMVSFSLKEDTAESAVNVLKRFNLFTLAESLGGVESLCGHPASMTHASIPREERIKTGVLDSLIRLSVGVEDIEDLLEDLKMALL